MFKRLRVKFVNSTLRRKIVFLTTILVTIIPTVLIAGLALTYYKLGIESLFNEKISKAVSNTTEVAALYLQEHKENIRADILAIAKDLELNYLTLRENPELFTTFLDKQVELRNLIEIVIFQRDGRLIAKNSLSFALSFENLPDTQLAQAQNNEVIILDSPSNDRVRALLKLNYFGDTTYLLVGRFVDRDILDNLINTQGSVNQYQILMQDIKKHQSILEITFVIVSIAFCALAIFSGVRLAKFITEPINTIIQATELVKQGDFSIRISEKQGKDETSVLTRAFNQMTATLEQQRSQLIQFNQLIDERRRFIEAVLSEISAGVITLTPDGYVNFFNTAAAKLLGIDYNHLNKLYYKDIFQIVDELIELAITNPKEIFSKQVEFHHNNKKSHLFIRVASQLNLQNKLESIIITFDDITDLISAQRTAAWADIARRIAHEIKNPLTPIHLAAERIKKKYLPEITTDATQFRKYLDTINKHVSEIGKMVEEFVDFARIPMPILERYDICSLIRDIVFEQECTFKNITYTFNSYASHCYVLCDAPQIFRALGNLLKNAAEAIEQKQEKKKGFEGKIEINLNKYDSNNVEIKIKDNGVGFDKDMLDRIFEPYVTTKPKGTGLGLSIVKKIVEDHGGKIEILSESSGANLVITLQLYKGEKDGKNS